MYTTENRKRTSRYFAHSCHVWCERGIDNLFFFNRVLSLGLQQGSLISKYCQPTYVLTVSYYVQTMNSTVLVVNSPFFRPVSLPLTNVSGLGQAYYLTSCQHTGAGLVMALTVIVYTSYRVLFLHLLTLNSTLEKVIVR